MSSPAPNNNRASLLAGLRTGGVRSASGPSIPHTAAPGGSFQIPRFQTSNHQDYDEDPEEAAEMFGHNFNLAPQRRVSMPMTAGAVDGAAPRFQQQQLAQQQMLRHAATQRASISGNPPFVGMDLQAQAQMQLQMQQMQMQMQLMALQQQQQYQAQMAAQQQQATSRTMLGVPRRTEQPSTAGPLQTSFDPRSTLAPNRLRPQGMDNLKVGSDDPGPVPMSAALGGKFGSRSMPQTLNPNANVFVGRNTMESDDTYSRLPNTPVTPLYGSTTVISGGTALGSGVQQPQPQVPQSKSDTAISWRRGGATGLAAKPVTPRTPSVTVSKPDEDSAKFRPLSLRLHVPSSSADDQLYDDPISLAITGGDVSPTSSSSHSPDTNGSASRTPSEDSGVGRSIPTSQQTHSGSPQGSLPNNNRLPSIPIRQPRGPPAGAEDLGQRNFSSRVKRKVIGGFIETGERREVAEIAAY